MLISLMTYSKNLTLTDKSIGVSNVDFDQVKSDWN